MTTDSHGPTTSYSETDQQTEAGSEQAPRSCPTEPGRLDPSDRPRLSRLGPRTNRITRTSLRAADTLPLAAPSHLGCAQPRIAFKRLYSAPSHGNTRRTGAKPRRPRPKYYEHPNGAGKRVRHQPPIQTVSAKRRRLPRTKALRTGSHLATGLTGSCTLVASKLLSGAPYLA